MSNSIYSNAFNFGSFMEGSVDPRTGQYSQTITVMTLQAQNSDSASRPLTITFSALDTINQGFGIGWSMKLPSLELTNGKNALTLSDGRTFKGNPLPPDGNDMTFKDQKLLDFRVTKVDSRTFDVYNKDGVKERLVQVQTSDPFARLSFLTFPNGETFQFYYEKSVDGVVYLTKIVHLPTGLDYLTVVYSGVNATNLRFPVDHSKTARIMLSYQNNLMTSVTLPFDNADAVPDPSALPQYALSYQLLLNTYQVIDRVRTPSGSVETIAYRSEGHKLNNGDYLPYAVTHNIMPGRQQEGVTKKYEFPGDNNFTGYASGSDTFLEDEDNLYLVTGIYDYQSREKVLDGSTDLITVERTFNKFHLLATQVKTQEQTRTTTTTTYNDDPSLGFYDQPANCQLPSVVTTTYEDLTNAGVSRTETEETDTDDYGNVIREVQKTGVVTEYEYYPAAGTAGECPADPFGFVKYVKSSTVIPVAGAGGSADERSLTITYLQLDTTDDRAAEYFVSKESEVVSNGLSRTFSYFDSGLMSSVLVSLNNNNKETTFTHESTNDTRTTTTVITGFDGASATKVDSLCTITKHDLNTVNAGGVEIRRTYDVSGRVIQQTLSPDTDDEVSRSYLYQFPQGSDDNAWPVLVETGSRNVDKRWLYDGLGRVCAEEVQDDDGDWDADSGDYDGTFRRLVERSYNLLGQVTLERQFDWLWSDDYLSRLGDPITKDTTYEYDGWGKLERTTLPDGHTKLSQHDPVAMTITHGIEGEGTTVVAYNLFKQPDTVTRYLANGDQYSEASFEYDGLGRKIQDTDALGNTTDYSHDAFDRVDQRTLADGTVVQVHYADSSEEKLTTGFTVGGTDFGVRTYDGLNRPLEDGVGGRTTTYGYENSRNDRPSTVTRPGTEELSVVSVPELGGKITSLSSDDTSKSYQYDPKTAAMTQAVEGEITQQQSYFASGLVQRVTEQRSTDGDTVELLYAYSMSGLIQKVVDVFGNEEIREYDLLGRLSTCTQSNRTATFQYDSASRLIYSEVQDTDASLSVTTDLAYDDFGRETLRTIQVGDQSAQLRSIEYDVSDRVVERITSVGEDVWRNESYEYDTRNRLIDYTCTGSQPPEDESGKGLSSQSFTFDKWSNVTQRDTSYTDGTQESITYDFDGDDPTQLTSLTINGVSTELQYDADGNLTRDEQGRELRYDDEGRLTEVLDSAGQTLSQYQYDPLNKVIGLSQPGQTASSVYYHGEVLSNRQVGDQQVAYMNTEGHFLAQHAEQGETSQTQLLATDDKKSLVTAVDAADQSAEHFSYAPYGHQNDTTGAVYLIGWNGDNRDPVTGWYFSGNGYRVYNPVLMRFHSPDNWSPFGAAGINPYIYCQGDPINQFDPTGHLSTGAWVTIGISAVGILFGIVTLGAGAAVSAGLVASTSVVGSIATTSASAAVATGLGVVSDVLSIASAATEDNPEVSKNLNIASRAFGLAGGLASLGGIGKSTYSAAKTATVETGASMSKSLARSTGKNALSIAGESLGVASHAVGIAAIEAAEQGNDSAASTLNWVSLGLAGGNLAMSLADAGTSMVSARRNDASYIGSVGSYKLEPDFDSIMSSGQSGTTGTYRSVGSTPEQPTVRLETDRVNNAETAMPPNPKNLYETIEDEVTGIIVTRL